MSTSRATSGTTKSVSPWSDTVSVRVGASGEAVAAADSVRRWSENADAIALSGVREARVSGHETSRLEDLQRIKDATTRVPVHDDSLLADIFQEWAIRRVDAEMPGMAKTNPVTATTAEIGRVVPQARRPAIRGKAMVVGATGAIGATGATGAIGSVCARLLALACDESWLVSPETAKLLQIEQDIERDDPRADHRARRGRAAR